MTIGSNGHPVIIISIEMFVGLLCNKQVDDPISMLGCGDKFHDICLLPSLVTNQDCPKCRLRLKDGFRKQWRDHVLQRLSEIIERKFGRDKTLTALYTELYGTDW